MQITIHTAKTHECDILVLGGGPAGLLAAIAAARQRKRVILVEQNGYCGGMATAGGVGPFMTCYNPEGDKMLIRGIFEEIVNRLVAAGDAIHPGSVPTASAFTSYIGPGHLHVTPFESEGLKRLADRMLTEAGVKVLYHTSFAEPLMDGNKVTGALVLGKSGFAAITAKVTIDCTGDADCAFRAGAPCLIGNGEGKMQPVTMFFKIGKVDSAAIEKEINENLHRFHRKNGINYRSFFWRVDEAREKGDWPLKRVSIGLFRSVKEDEWCINTSRIMGIDGTDEESLTEGEMEGRNQVEIIMNFIRKYLPGCQNAVLLSSAAQIGVRETRHIKGAHTLTVEEVLSGVIPEDSILCAANSIDVHGKFGPLSNQYITIETGKFYGVPYGCLVPDGVENLLVAGRSVSAEPDAAGAIRVMPPCMGMGEAAGVAAALAIDENTALRALDVSLLRAALQKNGVYLGGESI